MSSDETYLEAFIEGLSTLPNDVKRNMELIRDLDKSSMAALTKKRKLEQEYIYQAEEKMAQVEVVQGKDGTILGLREAPDLEPMFPCSEELFDFVDDPVKFRQIQELQDECLQKADEKVAVATQALELIEGKLQRLDHDLSAMETLLQATGEFQSGVAAKPNDMAACQVTPGSEWILAKVLQHDTSTGMYKLADEDIEIFHLPEQQVQILHLVEKVRAGDVVYAVYPDTTSFYQATVVQAPRKQGAGGAFVMVNFHDDADEFGITHDKAVPLKHVMVPPFGSNLN
eukprot:scaffold5237_cov179-Amphora_coffeaeformis.AAC.10